MIRPQWLKKTTTTTAVSQSCQHGDELPGYIFARVSFNVQIEDDAALKQGCRFGMTRNIK